MRTETTQKGILLVLVLLSSILLMTACVFPPIPITPSPGAPTEVTLTATTAPSITPTLTHEPSFTPTFTLSPSPTYTETPTSTFTPTPTHTPTLTPVPTFDPQKPPLIILPDKEEQAIKDTAAASGIAFTPLAGKYTVIYPKQKVAGFLLTPVEKFPSSLTWAELAKNPELIIDLKGELLGGLMVIDQVHKDLPNGPYAIVLTGYKEITFFDIEKQAHTYPLVIRHLLYGPNRPVAMITAVEMCLSWGEIQLCALKETPPDAWITGLFKEQIDLGNFKAGDYDIDLAVPDMEGQAVLSECSETLQQSHPDYTRCHATVLAAPVADPAVKVGSEYPVGAIIALEPIVEEIYSDNKLKDKSNRLEPGPYEVKEMIFNDDKIVKGDTVRQTRVGMFPPGKPDAAAFLPSINGLRFIGRPLFDSDKKSTDGKEAVILNLVLAEDCCLFQFIECPWVTQ